MRIKEMSIEAFMNEQLDVQIAQYNILAKRTNRQIRTFKKQGNEEVIKAYFPEIAAHVNIKMIKKTTTKMLQEMKPERAQEELTRAYSRLKHDVHGGITRENVMRIDKEMEKVKEALKTEDLSPEQYYAYKKAEEYAKSASHLYYEMLKYGVERGYYKSYSVEDRPDISDPSKFYTELKRINKWTNALYKGEPPEDIAATEMRVKSDLARSAKAYYLDEKMPDYTNNPPKEMRPRRTNVYVRR